MSLIPPVSSNLYRGMPVNFGATSAQKTETKNTNSDAEKKKSLPWGKILLGLAGVAFIEYTIRRHPVRREELKRMTQIFNSNPDMEPRRFRMLNYRDEVFINEALKGNAHAQESLHTITPDAPKYIRYVKLKEKIARTEQYLREGRFNTYSTRTQSAEEIREGVIKHLHDMQNELNDIYKNYIEPSIKF